MNIKKISKILTVILIIMMIFTIVQPVIQPVFAASALKPGDITPNDNIDTGSLQKKTQYMMGLIRNIAVVVGVIMLMIIGVKFMLGSAEEKAEYKKSLMPLVIGIVIVMMATTLITVVYNFANA